MKDRPPLTGRARQEMITALHRRYGDAAGLRQKFTYLRKTYTWLIVVHGARIVKRVIDVSVALLLLFLMLPVFLLIAILIKLTDGGPVLYVSKRVGIWGKEFSFPKFRSMTIHAETLKEELEEQSEHKGDVTFKIKNDPRTTWVGRVLRKTSLDEMPQLWCVLKGEMSLVGPRPPLPEEVDRYTLAQRRRLDTQPGLTCIWQVSGRSDIPFDQQVQLDLQYIQSQSVWLDLKILLKTIPAVLMGKGAY